MTRLGECYQSFHYVDGLLLSLCVNPYRIRQALEILALDVPSVIQHFLKDESTQVRQSPSEDEEQFFMWDALPKKGTRSTTVVYPGGRYRA